MRSVNSVIVDGAHPVASDARDLAAAAQPARLHTATALLARRARSAAVAAMHAAGTTGAAATATGNQLRRTVGAMRHVLETSYRDALFERPDVIEDDYYRFRHQPHGW